MVTSEAWEYWESFSLTEMEDWNDGLKNLCRKGKNSIMAGY